ncbi:uncharacterized protein A4U43_C07F19180 [Asparagus officinalis]|uniref:Phytocyanin domain-containing protein n=2 Tax=Asparagus officinalis TaxID=4686 RepID=A0A5P1EIB2_ASPOF|nr:uncharacterized protein A4U43_C07F19180 [Asparagus officinalis]
MMVVAIGLVSLASATEFVVGDDKGWNLGENYTAWAMGKEFKVGDTLVFNYKIPNHNVIKVDGANFKACTSPENSEPLATGSDTITLSTPGKKWYICGKSDHCERGMKLVINVASDVEAPNSPPQPDSSSNKIEVFQYLSLMAAAMTVAIAFVI